MALYWKISGLFILFVWPEYAYNYVALEVLLPLAWLGLIGILAGIGKAREAWATRRQP